MARLCAARQPEFVLETGFCTGRSTLTVLLACSPRRMVSVDADLDYMAPQGRQSAARMQESFPALRIVEANSKTLLADAAFWAEHFPAGIDWFTVDGDHTYGGCTADLEAGLRHLRPGGTLIVDDYRSDRPDGYPLPEVTRAVDDFVTRHGRLFEPPLVWNVRGKGFCALRALGGATAK
jgi:predicted O-methyltransferase YrrM